MHKRRTAERKLQQNEQILVEAQRIAQLGHWEYEPSSKRLTISDTLYEIFGINKKSPRLNTVDDFYSLLSEQERQRLLEELNKSISTGEPYETDYEIQLTNGKRKIISNQVIPQKGPDGRVMVIRGTSQDITERKAIEISLRSSEERFSSIFQLNPLPSVITKIKDGKILLTNRKALELFEFTDEEIQNQSTIQLNIWSDIEQRAKVINDIRSKRVVQIETNYKTKNGRNLESITSFELLELDGEECLLSIIQDIGELKRKEEAIKTYSQELEKLNENKDKFFSIIAHDLMSPVNSLLGSSYLLEQYVENLNYDEIKKLSNGINSSGNNLKSLLSNLLKWANTQSGHLIFNPEKINLKAVIRGEMEVLNDLLAKKNLELKTDLPENCEFEGDKNMIQTIIRNLISNAIKFSFNGSSIEVTARREPDKLMVSIRDTGIGMNDILQGKLFRIDNKQTSVGTAGEKGSGLGLHLCKEFVEKHGGKIYVSSAVNKGTTFTILLPLNQIN